VLLEEFSRHGASVKFLNAPVADTAEQRLLLQFQGMIAEYERAQIAERCRRGKRHRAKAGMVNVLSAAPYGYRYIKKTDSAQAYYEVVESEAEVVRRVFELYTVEGLAARAIAKRLNAEKIFTRSKKSRWTASTLWHMLTNPAYEGRAAYGKTEPAMAQRLTRIARRKGHYAPLGRSNRRRAREQWIEIAVPAIVSEQTFALAQERLASNKQLAARNTREPSVLQGILVCAQCGYALCRVSTRGATGRIYYYRCLGSDRRNPRGRVCDVRPKRVDYLDALVWEQVWQLLNHPQLIQSEIQRRLQEHRQNSPVEQRKDNVSKEIARLGQQTDKLIDALQEGLIDLGDLRSRIPELKRRQLALEKELASLDLQALEQSRLVELNLSMESFIKALKESAQNLDTLQKQKIIRLLVREVIVDRETATIHHSIPLLRDSIGGKTPSYRLCTSRPKVRAPREHRG
jgi:site-specific DNA recombinase